MAHAPLTLVPDTFDFVDDAETLPHTPAPERATRPLPHVVGGWRVYRRMGQGSTANVYTVRCGRLLAAMKVERAEATRSARSCIQREARWLRDNGGNGAPTLLDEGRLADGRAWFVMSMAPGQTLSDWWRDGGTKAPVEAVRIVARVARIMGDAHLRGWVHRDLKPSNISVGPDGEVTVLDWGLVHHNRPTGSVATRVAGTPGFIPPELFQTQSTAYSTSLDTYALGCCLIVLLSKRRLWPHQLNTATIRTVVKEAGITGISARTLEHILGRAISQAPQQRWTNGHTLAAELECWIRCMAPATGPIESRPDSALYRTPA